MATVTHPHIEPPEYIALQTRAGWRMDVELIAGEAVLVPPTGGPASSVQGELFLALRQWQTGVADGGLVLQDVFIAFPDGSHLAPDIAWWSLGRKPVISDGALESIPDLVVEVLSPATRANDLGIKREVYMRSGVREMWLADPAARVIARAWPESHDDELLGETAILRSDLLDGFMFAVERAFTF